MVKTSESVNEKNGESQKNVDGLTGAELSGEDLSYQQKHKPSSAFLSNRSFKLINATK